MKTAITIVLLVTFGFANAQTLTAKNMIKVVSIADSVKCAKVIRSIGYFPDKNTLYGVMGNDTVYEYKVKHGYRPDDLSHKLNTYAQFGFCSSIKYYRLLRQFEKLGYTFGKVEGYYGRGCVDAVSSQYPGIKLTAITKSKTFRYPHRGWFAFILENTTK